MFCHFQRRHLCIAMSIDNRIGSWCQFFRCLRQFWCQYNERLKIHSISEFRGWRGMLECGLFKNAIFFRWSTLAAVLCFLYCVTFGCLLWLLFQKLRRKPLNRPYQLALWCGLLEFGYLSSFLLFTPTPDYRYHFFCIFTGFLMVGFSALAKANRQQST